MILKVFFNIIVYLIFIMILVWEEEGPMHRNYGNLYDFSTCPGYGHYFISPIGGVQLGGIEGQYISKGGTGARAGWTLGTVGPK